MYNTQKTNFLRSRQTIIPILLFALPPLFWAGNFIVGRSVRAEIPPLQLSFYRWVIASIILLPYSIKMVHKDWPLYLRHKYLIVLASASGISAFNTLIYWGLQTTTANNALILNSFIPLLISLIGVFFADFTLRIKQWLGLIISFLGVFTIISRGDVSTLTSLSINHSDIIVFLAMICWAVYTFSLKSLVSSLKCNDQR